MHVNKELYLAAPRPHVAVYAGGQCYTQAAGTELIESVRLEARNPKPAPNTFGYYTPESYQRLSEDNGRTWQIMGPRYYEDDPSRPGEFEYPPSFFRDPDNGAIIKFVLKMENRPEWNHPESFSDAGTYGRSQRLFYGISHDRARTWGPLKQVIAGGSEFNAEHWGPGLYYGQNGGQPGSISKLNDGTLLNAITVNLFDGNRYQSGFLRGRWNADNSDLQWEFSDYIRMEATQSSQGCCESAPALLSDGRIILSLRCCGDRETKKFPSRRYGVMSEDGGRTFSAPKPLTYEDGAPVWCPSSYAQIWRASVNGRYYWIGNILDAPTYDSSPRYPLCIAELIPEQGVLIKDSVTIIDTKPDDFSEAGRRRYTNFGMYEDRQTSELVLTLPEQPKTDWADFTADCYRYRIRVA